jgi:hypothetical protein
MSCHHTSGDDDLTVMIAGEHMRVKGVLKCSGLQLRMGLLVEKVGGNAVQRIQLNGSQHTYDSCTHNSRQVGCPVCCPVPCSWSWCHTLSAAQQAMCTYSSSDDHQCDAALCVCPADMSDIMKQDMERFAARQQAAAAASSSSSSSSGTSRQVRHLASACTAEQRVRRQRTCTAGLTPVAGMGCGCGARVARHVWHIFLPVCQHV